MENKIFMLCAFIVFNEFLRKQIGKKTIPTFNVVLAYYNEECVQRKKNQFKSACYLMNLVELVWACYFYKEYVDSFVPKQR